MTRHGAFAALPAHAEAMALLNENAAAQQPVGFGRRAARSHCRNQLAAPITPKLEPSTSRTGTCSSTWRITSLSTMRTAKLPQQGVGIVHALLGVGDCNEVVDRCDIDDAQRSNLGQADRQGRIAADDPVRTPEEVVDDRVQRRMIGAQVAALLENFDRAVASPAHQRKARVGAADVAATRLGAVLATF
jgi:hypothetical protein